MIRRPRAGQTMPTTPMRKKRPRAQLPTANPNSFGMQKLKQMAMGRKPTR